MPMFIAFLLSFCSFIYQLQIVYSVIDIMNNPYFWQPMILAIFLLFLGIGTFYVEYKVKKDFIKELIKTEKQLLSISILSLIFIYLGSYFYNLYVVDNVATLYELFTEMKQVNSNFQEHPYYYGLFKIKEIPEFLLTILFFSLTGIIGFLTGKEFPLLIKIYGDKDENRLLAFNYFGTLIASIAFTYFCSKLLNPLDTLLVANLVNYLVYLYFLKQEKILKNNSNVIFTGVFLSFLMVTFTYSQSFIDFFNYSNITMNTKVLHKTNTSTKDMMEKYKKNYHVYKTKYQKVELLSDQYEKGLKEDITLYLNKSYQFNLIQEKMYHESMIHIPIMKSSKQNNLNVLIIGGGDFFGLREIIKYPKEKINSIDHVELDKEFWQLMQDHPIISKVNESKKVLADERYNVMFRDAFTWMRENSKKYDIIFIDIPFPRSYELSKLYSVEFYNRIFDTLTPSGLVSLDVPLYNREFLNSHDSGDYLKSLNSIIMNTFDATKFKSNRKVYGIQENSVFLLSYKKIINDDISLDFKLDVLDEDIIKEILGYEYPYTKDPKYINTIFKPVFKKIISL